MSERVVELIRTLGSGDLEERLQEAASQVGAGPLEPEDLEHLLHVLTDGALTLALEGFSQGRFDPARSRGRRPGVRWKATRGSHRNAIRRRTSAGSDTPSPTS